MEKDFLVLTLSDKTYPSRLRKIPDPPAKLYLKGSDLSLFNRPSIAVIGSRKNNDYGRNVTQKLVRELVENGFAIISGMARGIDTIAHEAALEAGGKTIAVLGSGIDVIYPRENGELYQMIQLVISEFPPGTKPLKENFPQRNRIVAGLANGVLVIEAAKRSGTLITARQAAEQGKDVFAVPGPITSPLSEGTAWLIKQGAKLVYSVNDILEEFTG